MSLIEWIQTILIILIPNILSGEQITDKGVELLLSVITIHLTELSQLTLNFG